MRVVAGWEGGGEGGFGMGCGTSVERPPEGSLDGVAWELKEAVRLEGTPRQVQGQGGAGGSLHPRAEDVLVEMAGRLRHEELCRVVDVFDADHAAGKATVSDLVSERLDGVRGLIVKSVLRPRAGPIVDYVFSRLGGKWAHGAFVEAFCHLIPDEVVRGDVQRMFKTAYGGAKGTTLRAAVEREADGWPLREALLRQGCCTLAEARAEWVADVVEGRHQALSERALVRMLVTMDGREVQEMRAAYEARHQAGGGLLADLEHELCGDYTEALRALAGRGEPLPGVELTAGQCDELIENLLSAGRAHAAAVAEGPGSLAGVEASLVGKLGMLSCDQLVQLKRHYHRGEGKGARSLHLAVLEAYGPGRFRGAGASDTLMLLSALLMPRKQAVAVFCRLCLAHPEGGSVDAGAWELACLLQHRTHAERAEIRWHYASLFHRDLGDDILEVYHASAPDVSLFLCSLADDVALSVAVTMEKAVALKRVDAFCVYLSTYYDQLMDEVRDAFCDRFGGEALAGRLSDLCDGNLRDVKVLQTFVNFASRSVYHGLVFVPPAGPYPHMDVGGMEEWAFGPAAHAPSFFKSTPASDPSRGPPPGPDAPMAAPVPIYWTEKDKPHLVYYSRDKAAYKAGHRTAFASEWHLARHKLHLGHAAHLPHLVK